jgi:uncharacterized membrane protein HdeD (DUF308 family)
MDVIGVAVGVGMLLFGIIKLVGYFSRDLFRLAFQYDLAFGLLSLALGIIVLVRPGNLMNFICLALGLAILADGLFKVQLSMDARTFGIRPWWLILALAVLTGALGLVMVFRPTESARVLVVLFGVALIFEGVLNLSTVLAAVKIIANQQPDGKYVDAEFHVK